MSKLQISGLILTVLMLLGIVLPISAVAEERYVRPNLDVPVRRGQGNQYKILKLAKNGELVELIKEGDSWAQVKLSSGTTGWLPKRFLSIEAPPEQLVKILRAENDRLQERDKQLTLELNELKELHSNAGGELSSCIAKRDSLEAEYKRLQTDTADITAINNKVAATEKEIESVQAAMQTVKLQNNELKRKTAVTWFLAGGGVLFLGWIIGLITCRTKRRRSSLL
jgi:SH3 domain protein